MKTKKEKKPVSPLVSCSIIDHLRHLFSVADYFIPVLQPDRMEF